MNSYPRLSDSQTDALNQPNRLPRGPLTYPFRVFHLLFLALALLMLVTGIMLHAGSAPGWSFFGDGTPQWVPAGRWVMWHTLGGILLLGTLLPALALYVYQSVHHRRPAGRAIWHWLLWIALGLMCLSGLLLFNNWGPARLYRLWRYIHLTGGALLLPILVIGHVCSGWTLGWRFWLRSFDPFRRLRIVALVLMLVPGLAVSCFLVLGGPLNPNPRRVLAAGRVSDVPADLWSFDWNALVPLKIRLSNGVGFRRGVTTMSLRAFHDGASLYMRADWDDAAEQRNLHPWLRTADGWKRLESGIENFEDKMAMVFPVEPSNRFGRIGCAYACHLGGGRDYGYKCTDIVFD